MSGAASILSFTATRSTRNYSLLTINYSLPYLTSHKLNCGI